MKKQTLNTKRAQKEPKRVRSPVLKAAVLQRFETTESDYRTRSFSVTARLCAFLLFLILLAQPVAVVFADELPLEAMASGSVSADAQGTVVDSSRQEVVDGPASATETSSASVTPAQEIATTSPVTPEEGATTVVVGTAQVSSMTDAVTPATEIPADEASSSSSTSEVIEASTTPENISLDTGTSSPENDATTPLASTSSTEVATSTSSSTEEVTVVMPEVTTQINDQNRYQFGVNDCVSVENGSFYCSKNAVPKITAEDKVYAAQDQDGDYEIFISKNGVDTQITHNTYDDRAPQYDASSNRLVWHALINDRYQVMMYDFNSQKMEQFTHETYNSMQPMVLGNRVVWQAWVNNNWEIILDENGVRTQLTNNNTQDIAPHIRGDLVSWQSQTGATQDITVFNLKTKETNIITGVGGADASNPRFLLVYDSLQANGDTATVGYDPETGKVVPLSAVPQSAPKEIPEPEHSKEKVAFVQTPPTLKNEGDLDAEDTAATTVVGGDVPGTTTVAVAAGDVVVVATTTVLGPAPEPAQISSVDMTGATSSQTESAVANIPDLIIPAFISTSTDTE